MAEAEENISRSLEQLASYTGVDMHNFTRHTLKVLLFLIAILRRTHSHILLELLMEVIHILVTYTLRNLIDLELIVHEKLYGVIDSHLVNVRVEALTHILVENLAKICTVITK